MADFENFLKPLPSGAHIRRSSWGAGSYLYVNGHKQVHANSNAPVGKQAVSKIEDYPWILDYRDLKARDSTLVT
jgi:hypothetical protein